MYMCTNKKHLSTKWLTLAFVYSSGLLLSLEPMAMPRVKCLRMIRHMLFLSCLVAYIFSADSSCIAAVSASVAVSLLCAVVLLILGSVSLMRACARARVYISHCLCGGGEGQPPAHFIVGIYVCVCIYV